MSISFSTTVLAIIKLFLIGLGGYLLVRTGVFSHRAINDLARLILYLAVPALVFFTMFKSFNPSLIKAAATIPLSAILLTALAGGIAIAGSALFSLSGEQRNVFFALMLFGNSGYLPIPLVMSILPEAQADQAIVYISLFLVVVSPLMWSYGVYLIGKTAGTDMPLNRLVSPPMVGIVLGVICSVLPPLRQFFSGPGNFFVESCELLGKATVPLAMILLGAILATLRYHRGANWSIIGAILGLKMLLLPVVVITLLYFIPLPNMVRLVIAIQAMTPPATNLVVIARTYGRSADLVSLTLLVTYLFALLTFPFFILITTHLFPPG